MIASEQTAINSPARGKHAYLQEHGEDLTQRSPVRDGQFLEGASLIAYTYITVVVVVVVVIRYSILECAQKLTYNQPNLSQ